jgi:hypothetical protein
MRNSVDARRYAPAGETALTQGAARPQAEPPQNCGTAKQRNCKTAKLQNCGGAESDYILSLCSTDDRARDLRR